jgi:hypothetical protein
MAQLAAITLNDGEATPVAHTFNPVGIKDGGVAFWADRSGGIALGYPVVSMSLREPKGKGPRNFRLTAKVVLPVLEQTSASTASGIQPGPTKAFDLIANVDMVLPERSTLAQRKDLAAFMKNFLANATFVTAAIESQETVF